MTYPMPVSAVATIVPGLVATICNACGDQTISRSGAGGAWAIQHDRTCARKRTYHRVIPGGLVPTVAPSRPRMPRWPR